jgi:hypothetical protein
LVSSSAGNGDAAFCLRHTASCLKGHFSQDRHATEKLAVQYFEDDRMHKGIICAVRRPPGECARRLLSLLNERTAEDFENQLLYI